MDQITAGARVLQLECDGDARLDRGGSSLDGNSLGFHRHGSRRGIARGDDALVLADGEHLAEPCAGSFGIELGIGDGVAHGELARLVLQRLGFRHAELDGIHVVGAERHHLVEDLAELADVVHGEVNRVRHLIADDVRRPPILPLFIERLHGEIRGLDVLRVEPLGLQRCDHLGHGSAVLGERLLRPRRLAGDSGGDVHLVGRGPNGTGGGERDGPLRRLVGAAPKAQGGARTTRARSRQRDERCVTTPWGSLPMVGLALAASTEERRARSLLTAGSRGQ